METKHICFSFEDAMTLLRQHEAETNTKFVVYTCRKNFGRTDIRSITTVYWQDKGHVTVGRMNYEGVPFSVCGCKLFDCEYGRDRKVKFKQTREANKTEPMSPYNRTFPTKKFNCPAKCVMREIIKFPTYQIQKPNPDEQYRISREILDKILAGEDIPFVRQIVVVFPDPSDHAGHPKPGELETKYTIRNAKRKALKMHKNGTGAARLFKISKYNDPILLEPIKTDFDNVEDFTLPVDSNVPPAVTSTEIQTTPMNNNTTYWHSDPHIRTVKPTSSTANNDNTMIRKMLEKQNELLSQLLEEQKKTNTILGSWFSVTDSSKKS